MIISQYRGNIGMSTPSTVEVCLICFEPNPVEVTRVCETCTEAVVCQDCLEQYRKHWNQQCCICKKGEGVKIPVLETEEEEDTRRVSRSDKILFYTVSLYSFLTPIPLLWLWIECDIFAKPIDKMDAIFRAMTFWLVISPLIDLALIYRRYQYFWGFLVKSWLSVGNCLYVLVAFLLGDYGTFIFYLGAIVMCPLLLLIPLVCLSITVRAMIYWTFRGSSFVRPI